MDNIKTSIDQKPYHVLTTQWNDHDLQKKSHIGQCHSITLSWEHYLVITLL